MISAFGVDHGEISKSWKKLEPKLQNVSHTARATDDMARRMKVNYAQWRYKSGYKSKERKSLVRGVKSWENSSNPHKDLHIDSNLRQISELPGQGKAYKQYSNIAIQSHSNNTKKSRFLP